ncbi:hypothetical protein OAD18_10750 [Oceanospirillaceae bacterium]|jgi:hypothetical protein|nr:hypothetical protein [Oceanospirillaceae bacterium]|tara:strand:+ start:7513 stop:8112 length:600 start_codon:yes stop_codon:yes gene_type:complete
MSNILSKLEYINEDCHGEVLEKWQLAEAEDSEALRVAASDAQAINFKDLVYRTLTNENLSEIKELLENDQFFHMQFSDWFKTSYEEQQNIENLFYTSSQICSLSPVPHEVGNAIDYQVWSPDAPIWFQNWFSIDCENPSTLKIWQIEWIKHRALEYYTDAKFWLENGEICSDSLNDAKIDFQNILDFFNKSLKNIPSSL